MKFLLYVELMILLTVTFLALCARLQDLSIEHILNLDSLYYWFVSEASAKEFSVMMICQPILL